MKQKLKATKARKSKANDEKGERRIENSLPTYRTLDTYLAGVMHDERYLVIPQLSLREPVRLRRESDNPWDANAILVETQNGQQVGHIRRDLASYLAPQIDEGAQPITARVTELSSDAEGSAYRVRINFSVPADWLNRQENVEHTSDQPTEYTYDDTGPNVYVLLNSSEERFSQIREKMTEASISYTQYGLCYRAAHNGRPYQWYIRVDKTSEMNKGLIEDFFREHFSVAPEFELERSESEILELRTKLKFEKDYANLAERIAADRELEKQDLLRKIKSLQGELWQIDDKSFDSKKLKTFQIFSDCDDGGDSTPGRTSDISDLFKEVISETLTPRQSLRIIERLFPTRIQVLKRALESADESEKFRDKKKLFSLLWKLATEYWCALASGGGDTEARLVFGEQHYAAQESKSVMGNPRKRERRTFTYKDEPLPMMKHLKIGINKGVSDTIRVHFEWVDRVIVIGHCGPHL